MASNTLHIPTELEPYTNNEEGSWPRQITRLRLGISDGLGGRVGVGVNGTGVLILGKGVAGSGEGAGEGWPWQPDNKILNNKIMNIPYRRMMCIKSPQGEIIPYAYRLGMVGFAHPAIKKTVILCAAHKITVV
jgi:hypothetical protein